MQICRINLKPLTNTENFWKNFNFLFVVEGAALKWYHTS